MIDISQLHLMRYARIQAIWKRCFKISWTMEAKGSSCETPRVPINRGDHQATSNTRYCLFPFNRFFYQIHFLEISGCRGTRSATREFRFLGMRTVSITSLKNRCSPNTLDQMEFTSLLQQEPLNSQSGGPWSQEI